MKDRTSFAIVVSWFVLLGIPLFFLIISLSTGNWKFVLFSIPPALLSGVTGLMTALHQKKKNRIESVL